MMKTKMNKFTVTNQAKNLTRHMKNMSSYLDNAEDLEDLLKYWALVQLDSKSIHATQTAYHDGKMVIQTCIKSGEKEQDAFSKQTILIKCSSS